MHLTHVLKHDVKIALPVQTFFGCIILLAAAKVSVSKGTIIAVYQRNKKGKEIKKNSLWLATRNMCKEPLPLCFNDILVDRTTKGATYSLSLVLLWQTRRGLKVHWNMFYSFSFLYQTAINLWKAASDGTVVTTLCDSYLIRENWHAFNPQSNCHNNQPFYIKKWIRLCVNKVLGLGVSFFIGIYFCITYGWLKFCNKNRTSLSIKIG